MSIPRYTRIPNDWQPGRLYDRSHVGDCTRCGCTANEHDRSWMCPPTLLYRWNRFKRKWLGMR